MILRPAAILAIASFLGAAPAVPESVVLAGTNLIVAAQNLELAKGPGLAVALEAFRREAEAWVGAAGMPPAEVFQFPALVYGAPTGYSRNAPALTPTANDKIKLDVLFYLKDRQKEAKTKLDAYLRGMGSVTADDPRIQVTYKVLDAAEILLGRLSSRYSLTLIFPYDVPGAYGLPKR